MVGARGVLELLGDEVGLPSFLRDASTQAPHGAKVVEGDVLDAAMRGVSLVSVNLAGAVDAHACAIISAMRKEQMPRLVFVTTVGSYDEAPGEFGRWNHQMLAEHLPPYRNAADLIEASGLDSTVLRPAWLFDADEVDFEVTQRDEPFKGTEVSRKSVASLIVEIIEDPKRWSRSNLGVRKPGTDGDRPSFMR